MEEYIMENKRVGAVFIIAILLVFPSVISIGTYNDSPITVNIPDALSASKIKINVINSGPEEITNIAIFGEIQKIVGLVIIGDIFTNSIASLPSGETEVLQTQRQFGIGLMNYNVSASWDNCTVYYDRLYLISGILIFPI
jgi:hypothetical protein